MISNFEKFHTVNWNIFWSKDITENIPKQLEFERDIEYSTLIGLFPFDLLWCFKHVWRLLR